MVTSPRSSSSCPLLVSAVKFHISSINFDDLNQNTTSVFKEQQYDKPLQKLRINITIFY